MRAMAARRRALIGKADSARLPGDYQEVEYLQTQTTGQYIDTGFSYDQNCSLFIKALIPAGANWAVGARVAYNNNQVSFLGADTRESFLYVRFHNQEWQYTGLSSAERANPISLALSKNNAVVTTLSQTLTRTFTAGQFLTPSVYLFALNSNGTTTQPAAAGVRIYDCRFYSGDTLTRDLVPCYRKSDSKPGLYDLAGRVFYTNAGTGEFVVGPNV